ncbi:MAG TPA: alginate lyase family protein [Steroidobacteraceae bacterium]
MLSERTFRFLNQEGSLESPEDWNSPARTMLWSYNLHYFDDLNSAGAETRSAWHRKLVNRWITENPPGHALGWDPYPISRRMVNWIKWCLKGQECDASMSQSLAVQARWLTQRLEHHLQGNHLFANAKALIYAGLFFQGDEAETWLETGWQLATKQIPEQVLSDGGHFERSTMYHAGFLEDLLDVIAMAKAYGRTIEDTWDTVVARMLSWLEAASHPDGEIAFFNDAAFGVFPTAQALRHYASQLVCELPPRHGDLRQLMPSGYLTVIRGPWYLMCDVAPVGPDHLPAHAHADTLSFEMSYLGRRVFVNSGTSEYGMAPERQRQRGTAAHNTVIVDGQDSSEVWAGFRVARRARAYLLRATCSEASVNIIGEHDGYKRLPGANIHHREWRIEASGIRVHDSVKGSFGSAESRFHLHPDVTAHRGEDANTWRLGIMGGELQVRFEGARSVELLDTTWHPEFGRTVPNKCLVARFQGADLKALVSQPNLP